MVKGQIVPDDETSSESCLRSESHDLVQEQVEGQEKFDLAALAANLEEAGTWYYVVDCATCKTVIPFKHAPEDEQIFSVRPIVLSLARSTMCSSTTFSSSRRR